MSGTSKVQIESHRATWRLGFLLRVESCWDWTVSHLIVGHSLIANSSLHSRLSFPEPNAPHWDLWLLWSSLLISLHFPSFLSLPAHVVQLLCLLETAAYAQPRPNPRWIHTELLLWGPWDRDGRLRGKLGKWLSSLYIYGFSLSWNLTFAFPSACFKLFDPSQIDQHLPSSFIQQNDSLLLYGENRKHHGWAFI